MKTFRIDIYEMGRLKDALTSALDSLYGARQHKSQRFAFILDQLRLLARLTDGQKGVESVDSAWTNLKD